ncbi:hypothetical protein CVT25_015084 [Psilocybe cyanescens]|uniref:DUF6699 domain-containing protein n=1 Tax=Psilocybe cyanescens TaxID=93625 RepID=A0A409WS43_PSICY|nr:hypothetical protein CVT25_015084 [Psilocybe cyanescens]
MPTRLPPCSTSYSTTSSRIEAATDSGSIHMSQYSRYSPKSYINPGSPSLWNPCLHDEGNYPPPLISRRMIALPALAACPIILNPLLAYTANVPPIIFDLSVSASAAALSPSTGSHALTDPNAWRKQPAMRPANIGSMTIRLAFAEAYSLWRPIVVFPESIYDSVVTIDDVLKAVSRAFRVAVLERQGHRDECDKDDNKQMWQTLMPSYLLGNGVQSNAVWWAGLYTSPDERDVWILDTRMYSHI